MAKKDKLSSFDGMQSVAIGDGPAGPGQLSGYSRQDPSIGGRLAGYEGQGPQVTTQTGGTGLDQFTGQFSDPTPRGGPTQGRLTAPAMPGTTGPGGTGAGAAAPSTPAYAGTWEQQLQDLYDQITGRDPFSYNVNMDPIYQNYKDQYIQGGKMAMKDTMGQAAGLTGGYGSTYSQAAGQQAYDQYLTQLTDKIPELYEMAYGMYKDQGDELMDQYGLLSDLRNTEYGQWRDAMSDFYNDRDFSQRQSEFDREFGQRQSEFEREFEQRQSEIEYQHRQDAYSRVIAMIQATGYNPTDAELEAAGMTRREANKLREAWKKAQKTGSGGGGGGGGGRGPGTTKPVDLDKDEDKDRDDAVKADDTTEIKGDRLTPYQEWLAEQQRKREEEERRRQLQQQRGNRT